MTMIAEAQARTRMLQSRMAERGISHAVFTSESAIAYLAGFWGYLGIEFGRPTMLVVPADAEPIVITPHMESEMVTQMTWVPDVRTWQDAGQRTWARVLGDALPDTLTEIWIERSDVPAILRNFLDQTYGELPLRDIGPVLGAMRMIKSPPRNPCDAAGGRNCRGHDEGGPWLVAGRGAGI